MNYTPGPWEVSNMHLNEAAGGVECLEVYAPNGKHASWVALVMEEPATGRKAEGEANARLIAAAPELLEALKDGIRLISTAHRRQDCYCDLCFWSGRMENLVTKAEGKQP